MRKVLILCTKNSSRSIIAKGLINKYLNGIRAYSLNPNNEIHPNAQRVLESKSAWSSLYIFKTLEELRDIAFDLVVIVCDNEDETTLPIYKRTEIIHVPFKKPEEEKFETFELLLNDIKKRLLPIVRKKLS